MKAIPSAIALDVRMVYGQATKIGMATMELHRAYSKRQEEAMQRACEEIAEAANNARVLASFLERKIAIHRRRNPSVRS